LNLKAKIIGLLTEKDLIEAFVGQVFIN
jgi:hypothetical protein